MYNILPETENRTLEEIEIHFADNSKKITDRYISPIYEQQNGYEKSNDIDEVLISPLKNDEQLTIHCGKGVANRRKQLTIS